MVKLYQNNSVVNAEKQNCGELSEDAPLLNSKRPPSQVSCFRVVGFLIFIAFLGLWGALGYYGKVATKEEIVVVRGKSDQPTHYIQLRKFDERSVISLPPRPSALVPDVKTTETGVSDTETLDDFLAVLNVATKIADITQAVEKLLPAIDLIGSVIELIFKFLPHESDYEKIVGQFNTVNEKLDALAYRMDQEADKILIAIDWATYKEQRQKILAVSESFNLMVLHINDTSFESEFVKTCDSIKVEQSLQYFEWEMNATHADSLVHLLTKEYHLKFFLLRSTDILSTATKAAFLLGACLRKQQLTENISNDLIQVYEGIAKEKVQSIVKSIYDRESFIKEGFMKYLTGEVNAKSEEAGYMANDVFASQLFDYVSDKYNWKRWFVASYNGNTFGFDNHAIFAGGDAIWQRHSNRHVMVATLSGSVKDSDRSWMKQTVSSCLSPHVFSAPDDWKDCLHLAKDLIPCLKNGHQGSGRAIPSFSMLACVRFGHGLRAVMHSEAPIFFENIGAVKCNGGYAVVEKERVDCWRDFVGCQDWMYPKYPLNNDIDKCISFFWNSRDYTADNSMIFLP